MNGLRAAAWRRVALCVLPLAGLTFLASMPVAARGDIYVLNFASAAGNGAEGTISQYSQSGQLMNPAVVSGLLDPRQMALSGQNFYVATTDPALNSTAQDIGQYTTSGVRVNAALISGTATFPAGVNFVNSIAVSGSNIFVANSDTGTVGEYSISGDTINANLITGLNDPGGIAISGSQLFVANINGGTIGEYTLGATPGTIASSTPSLISGLQNPTSIGISGNNLFVASLFGPVGEYTTSGGMVHASLLSGLSGGSNFGFPTYFTQLAISGSNLFLFDANSGIIGEFTTSGETVKASLISGLPGAPQAIVVSDSVPEPASLALMVMGAGVLAARRRSRVLG
ncbi:MAG TPA: PEP-CTERM sorting domain-containing protein [Phycisphaerae bacterium]|jgi:hypothetical protein